MKPSRALAAAFLVGTLFGAACGPVKEVGPTALVLVVYFNEARGTKALLISGTADVDGAPVNVFPTSQRPETLTGAAFPVPQSVRVLLNDSRAGAPVQLTVIGLNADGEAVEAATQVVTPVAQKETPVELTLKPFTDSTEPDGGVSPDAGLRFDAGTSSPCQCTTGCCDMSGRCASPVRFELGSRETLSVVLSGPTNQVCNGVCPVGKTSAFTNGACVCGSSAPCGEGLRCDGNARCTCDASSGCRGCCATGQTCVTRPVNLSCGSAGNQCTRCEGASNTCLATGRCSQAMCSGSGPIDPARCCSGQGLVSTRWPTCTSTTGDCVACDPLRSNACRTVGVGSVSSPCTCGSSGPCPAEQLCLTGPNGQATCRRPF